MPGSSRKSVSASMAWLVLVAVLFPSQAGASCLPEAIDIAERKYLTNLYGESYPMGVYVGNWDASFLTSHLLKIIVEDRALLPDLSRSHICIHTFQGSIICIYIYIDMYV